jgi:hypothetical protein
VKALCGMFMKNWVILGFNGPIVCSMHNIGGEECNFRFNNLFFGVCFMIGYEFHSIHLHFIFNHYPSWGLVCD